MNSLVAVVALWASSVYGFVAPSLSLSVASGPRRSTSPASSLPGFRAATGPSPSITIRMGVVYAPVTPIIPQDTLTSAEAGVQRVHDQEEYLNALAESQDQEVVVKFFTPYCRSCKAMDRGFKRMAAQYKKSGAPVKFLEVDVTEARDLQKSLDVMAVPTIMVHAGEEGLVERFSCGPSKLSKLKQVVEKHLGHLERIAKNIEGALDGALDDVNFGGPGPHGPARLA